MTADERRPAPGPDGDGRGQRVIARERPGLPRAGEPVLATLREAERASDVIRGAAEAPGRHGVPRRRPIPRRGVLIYGIVTAVLAAAYVFSPQLVVPAWALIVLSSIAAVVVGTIRNRPRRRLPWALLGAGYVTFAVGTLIALAAGRFPSPADVVFLCVSAPLVMLGLLSLTRSGARTLDRASMIDAVILTIGAGFLAWTFLINPFLHTPDLTPLEKAVSIAYPMVDVLMLAILARLGLTAARSGSVTLLMVSGASLLAADVLYGLSRLNDSWQLGGAGISAGSCSTSPAAPRRCTRR